MEDPPSDEKPASGAKAKEMEQGALLSSLAPFLTIFLKRNNISNSNSTFLFICNRVENNELQQDIADFKLELADAHAELKDRSIVETEPVRKKGKGWKSPSAKKVS